MSIATFLFLQAVKEHITEKYDLDYEVFSQPLQFDDHLKLEVAEEEAKRQGYKITPLIDNAIVRLQLQCIGYLVGGGGLSVYAGGDFICTALHAHL